MKTINSTLKLSLIVVIATLTYACEDISNPEPIELVNPDKIATIEGSVYANLDETNDTTGIIELDYETAPENAVVKVVLDSRDFAGTPQPGVNYQSLTYNTTVDGSGKFTIEVPALDDAINAEIYVGEFSASQTQADSTQQSKIYSPSALPYNVSIVADLTTFHNITYATN